MTKLFVGGLSFSTTREALRSAFSQFGEVLHVQLVTDRESGRSKGFGFVELASDEAAQDAIAVSSNGGWELNGRTVTVNVARPKADAPRESRYGEPASPDPMDSHGWPSLDSYVVATADGLRLMPMVETDGLSIEISGEELGQLLYPYFVTEPTIRAGISEFEGLLNDPATPEAAWQDLFTRHPAFLTWFNYDHARPHLTLRDDNGAELIPDFVLVPSSSERLADLVELKLPRHRPIVGLGGRRAYLSTEFTKACRQLIQYRDFFENPKNAAWFRHTYGFDMFRPEMILLMGRNVGVSPQERKRLVTQVQLWTYDELLARVKQRRLGWM